MDYIKAIIIAVIEGLTEFLPISSTAHMRITQSLMGMNMTDKYTETFTVAIQLGAILSVVVLYWRKFFDFKNISFYLKLLVAILPALMLGKIFGDWIDSVLEKPWIIALIMLLGGVLLLFVDKWFTHNNDIKNEKEVNFITALRIGMFQCLALVFPGLSRSAATIVGGMSLGMTRNAAAEFSFFLAVPTMMAATGYKLLKHYQTFGMFDKQELKYLAVGNIVAFVVALLAIKFFIGFLKKYGFKIWGYYRIALAILIFILIYLGKMNG